MPTVSPDTYSLTPSTKLPLYGKRIVITAPRNYASRLSEQIINEGGLPLLMPTIETCLLDDYTALDTALKQIDEFNWSAFTSRNGIEAFFQRMRSEEHTSELQSRQYLVCRLLLEKKKNLN